MRAIVLEEIAPIEQAPLKLRDVDAPTPAAGEVRIEAHTVTYDLPDANRALLDMKESRIDGTGVLLIDA